MEFLNLKEMLSERRLKMLGYWFFGAERYLAITPKNGETKVACAWTATEGTTIKTD